MIICRGVPHPVPPLGWRRASLCHGKSYTVLSQQFPRKIIKDFCLFEKPSNYLTPQFRPPAQYSFHSLNLLYLVLVWMEQFSGQFSETSTGLNKFGQHSSLAQTRRQKSATWSEVRTILATARYVLPLYLEMRKSDGENAQLLRPAWYGVFRKQPLCLLTTE